MAKPRKLRSTLGLFELAQTIDRKLDKIYALANSIAMLKATFSNVLTRRAGGLATRRQVRLWASRQGMSGRALQSDSPKANRESVRVCGNELMLGIDSRNHERLQASFNGRKSRISTAQPVILIVSDWLIFLPLEVSARRCYCSLVRGELR